jgi:hypothetical protein
VHALALVLQHIQCEFNRALAHGETIKIEMHVIFY